MENHGVDLSDRLEAAGEAVRDFCAEIERLTGEKITCIRWEVLHYPEISYCYYHLRVSGREYWSCSLAEALALARKCWPDPAPAVDPAPKLTSDAKDVS